MKRTVVFALMVLTGVASAQLSYDFDADAEGWRRGDFAATTLTLSDLGPATYNSAGYIEGDDFAGYAFHLSPALGGLNLEAAYGTPFTLDYSTQGAGGTNEPFVVLTNGSAAMYTSVSFAGGGAFTGYSFPLDTTGGWFYGTSATNIAPATETQIRSILSSLTRIGVTADIAGGADFTRLDNVSLAPVPEPASLAVLGLGLAALLKRKRRD